MEAQMSTCFIGEVPDELLVAIASQLQVERGYVPDTTAENDRRSSNAITISSLYALTLCCRRLNAIATPFLYQCIIRTEQFMALLLPTLLHNPHLGRYIQYIEITTPESPLPSSNAEMATWRLIEGFDQPTRDQYFERMKGASWIIPEREFVADATVRTDQDSSLYDLSGVSESTLRRLRGKIQSKDQDSLVVLLSLAVNLQDVAIGSNYTMGDTEILALRKYHNPCAFKRLWVCSGYHNGLRGYMLRYMCLNAKDPGGSLAHYLSSLMVPSVTAAESRRPTYALPLSALEEVSFTMQDVSNWLIDHHLSGCASLKIFNCRWQWTDEFIPAYPVDLPWIHQCLSRFQSSLTRLTIDTTESAWRVDLDTWIPALGSLRGFKVLAYVDVAALVLWGDGDFWEQAPLSELLPESLEHLILKTEWDEDIEDKLYQLSSECAISLPRLKRVECTWKPAPSFIADLLIDACHLAGVDLILDVEGHEASA
jgi:hypothetical protein